MNDPLMTDRPLPLVAGIVNATGDSFSERAASAPESAPERALAAIRAGADWLDLGGESTRPGSLEIPPDEELRRLLPVIRAVTNEPISEASPRRRTSRPFFVRAVSSPAPSRPTPSTSSSCRVPT